MALIVLTFLGTTGSWHVDGDDPDCAPSPSLLAHDHSAHHERLLPAAKVAPIAHCAICHWLQNFRIDGARQARADLAQKARSAGAITPVVAVRSADPLNLPSRAPPTVV